MAVTIKDIARETGLSLATISKYLNHKKIQDENKSTIEEAINRLNYTPNRTAQTLRSKKTMTIGIVFPNLGNYFWGPLISSVTHFFFNYGYTVITSSYYSSRITEKEVIQDLIARHVDGIVMLPYDINDKAYHVFQEVGIPVVVLDHFPIHFKDYPVDCVLSDNYGGCAQLAEYLVQKGHTHICVLSPLEDSYSIAQRVRGVQEVFQKHDLADSVLDHSFVFKSTHDIMEQGGKRFMDTMNSPTPPTAIIFTNYFIALGALMEASSSGYVIPDDISVVVFDDDPLFKSMYPPITSAGQNLELLGENASKILLRRIQGDTSDFPAKAIVPVTFNERKSVRDLNN